MAQDSKSRLKDLRSADGGFGLIEAMVALVIIFGLVLTLMSTLDASTRILVSTRQQSAGNALAIELIERAQALEWQNMGLASSTNGPACPGEVGCYLAEFPGRLISTSPGFTFDGEEMVFATGDTFRPFLDFQEVLDRDGTDFTRYIMITSVDDDGNGTEDYRRLTAVVRWNTRPGFIDEVVQSTIVSPFEEPNQPLLRTDVAWEGGTFGLGARTDPLVYDPDTAIIGDEITIAPLFNAARANADLFELSTVFARLNTITISDYISSAEATAESASMAVAQFAGADNIFGTADDTTVSVDPSTFGESADDDTINAVPITNGPSFGVISAARMASASGIVVMEVNTGSVASPGPAVNLSTAWLLDVIHDDIPAIPEELPYGQVTLTGTDKTLIGAARAAEEFTFYNRSGGFNVATIADRDDDSALGVKDTLGSINLNSGAIQLFDDTVMAANFPKFEGWVVLQGMTGAALDDWGMEVSGVTAGQSPYAAAATSGGVRLKIWDAASGDYFPANDFNLSGAMACGSPLFSTSPTVQQVEFASPLGIKAIGYDDVRYTVRIELDLRGFCETSTLNAFGEIAEHTWQTSGPILSGTIDYILEGKTSTAVYEPLIDLQAAISLDQINITSVYIDPDAS